MPAPRELLTDPNPGFLRGALHAIYDLAWLIALVLASPWLFYRMARAPSFRRMVLERFGRGLGRIGPPERPRILVHGVSLGEVKAAVPIVKAIEERFPEVEVLLSSSTETGMEMGTRLFGAERLVRFPGDPSWLVRRFLKRVQPSLVLLVELEVWPNFLRLCNRTGIPVAVVNGRITDLSHGQYLFFRKFLPQFNRISLFCVQLEEYAERFRRLVASGESILVTGNVKFDGLRIGPLEPGEELTRLLGGAGRQVVVAGSTHPTEERVLAALWREHAPGARLVLAPRHPERCAELEAELEELGFPCQRLSRLRAGVAPDPDALAIVDTIGELESVYALADLVFVGGSLVPHGGHNLLEPAAQGRALLFGPHVENFLPEAALLTLSGGCRQVAGPESLGLALEELLADPGERERMGRAAMRAVSTQLGATAKTVDALTKLSLSRIVREQGAPEPAIAAR